MATLILTAVGNAVGGPIGGALGSILGQQLDRSLFGPKARQGPRLGELAVQTSTYGAALPKLFGRMRVAGSVIWATDLIERRSTSSGKGQPKTVNHAYSANFAVALSARPIVGVRRIWADGKLLRGAAGDFKSPTSFRLHLGDEDQAVDPLIASAEGTAETPAFRGIAYAVFEDFELGDYGNRIPSLTFELEADDGPVAIGTIAETLATGVIAAGASPSLTGFAASGDSVRAVIEALADPVGLSLTDTGAVLRLGAPDIIPRMLRRADEQGRREILRQAAAPCEVSFAYFDPARDFNAGLQRALTGEEGAVECQALAAALPADSAKAMAEARLASARAARTQAKLRLSWMQADLRPGAIVALEAETGLWATRRWRLGPMTVDLELERIAGPAPPPAPAEPGQGGGQPDAVHGQTVLRLVDIPIGDPLSGRPLLFVVAAGEEPGWRRAALLASFDGGASWSDAGATAAPAVMGATLEALADGQALLFDDATVKVSLPHPGMTLEHASDEALVTGANLALLGEELIQFGRATDLGEGRFRLSRLLRGRRGTEWAMSSHLPGEPFTLIEAVALAAVEAPMGSIGGLAKINAVGVGDAVAAGAELLIRGESLLPPAPVGLSARQLTGGDIAISWIRRSRLGWVWASGAGTPLGEEGEQYRLVIAGETFERTEELDVSSFRYTVAMQAVDGASRPLRLSVHQAGDHGRSRPATLTLH
jgi:Putative phage tail protein